MDMKVSLFCGAKSACAHAEHPEFYRSSWDSTADALTLSRVSSSSSSNCTTESIEDTEEHLATILSCESCTILTDLELPPICTASACFEKLHHVKTASDERRCWLSSSAYVQFALENNVVLISNSPATDPRFRLHVTNAVSRRIANIMVVPLVVAASPGTETRVGALVCINRRSCHVVENSTVENAAVIDGTCSGFTGDDYARHAACFDSMATRMLLEHYQAEITRAHDTLAEQSRTHTIELTRMTQSRETFIATMSHEIRTPLNAVNGYNEIMFKNIEHLESSGALFASCLRMQRDAVLQLTRLIANILDFSKLKSRSLKLDTRPFSLAATIDKVVNMFAPDCAAKNIVMHVTVDRSVPDTLIGDQTRVYQVLSNLVSNAVKFTPHGFIDISVSMSSSDGGNVVQVRVRDSGRGVPVALQETIFEDFRQIRDPGDVDEALSPTTSPSMKGVGLGLSICRELVRLMRGELWIESDGRTGSTFVFTMRLRTGESVERMVDEVRSLEKPLNVLIVDDMEVNRVLLTRMCIEWGCTPHTCSSIDEAMHTLGSFPDSYFGAVIIDMDIGGESGLSLARRISNDSRYASLLLVAASSLGSSFLGADEFDAVHEKPIHQEDMLADLLRLLKSGPTRRIHRAPQLSRGSRVTSRPTVVDSSRRSSTSSDTHHHRVRNKILVVDDDVPSLTVVRLMLVHLGVESDRIITTASASEALELLESSAQTSCSIGLVLMDIVMTPISGIECIKRIRQSPERFGSPPIMALTADALDTTRTRALDVGANYFSCKPVSMDVLGAVLREVFTSLPSPHPNKKRKKSSHRRRSLRSSLRTISE